MRLRNLIPTNAKVELHKAVILPHMIYYTGGILQRLDTDVHSAVTAKMSTALWQRKPAQRCDSDGAGSNVTALTLTAQGQ